MSVRRYVHLLYRHAYHTGTVSYVFTLFKRQPYGNERIYQLEINQFRRPVKDKHKVPHEHIGTLRRDGDATWASWRYDETIAYFSVAANVAFKPVPLHAEDFQLKASP